MLSLLFAAALAATDPRPAPARKAAPPSLSPRSAPAGLPRYHRYPVRRRGGVARVEADLGRTRLPDILKVNRIDLEHMRQGDTLVVPDTLHAFQELSPFPARLAAARGAPHLLLVSLRVQAFAAYDSGALVRWGPTSTGRREMPTPARLLHTNWKARQRTSTFNEEWLLKWYVNLDNHLGISIHQYDLPGYPASHSCVRVLPDDAEWLYRWAVGWKLSENGRKVTEEGTPVVVMGAYAWDAPPPWKLLPDDPLATDVPSSEIEGALRTDLPAGIVQDGR